MLLLGYPILFQDVSVSNLKRSSCYDKCIELVMSHPSINIGIKDTRGSLT